MIPFLLTYRRLIAYGLLALVLSLTVWRVYAWHSAYDELPGVQKSLEAERVCGEGSHCAARVAALKAAQEQITKQVVSDYEAELDDIRNRPMPVRVIRVCRAAGSGDVRVPGSPGSADGTGPAAGVVSGPIEFDTGPLRDLARDADELAARLRALQEWNRALSSVDTQ